MNKNMKMKMKNKLSYKVFYTAITLVLFSINSKGQTLRIENGGFEDWNEVDNNYYPSTGWNLYAESDEDSVFLSSIIQRSEDAYEGSYALKINPYDLLGVKSYDSDVVILPANHNFNQLRFGLKVENVVNVLTNGVTVRLVTFDENEVEYFQNFYLNNNREWEMISEDIDLEGAKSFYISLNVYDFDNTDVNAYFDAIELVNSATATVDKLDSDQVKLYPNPSSSHITIESKRVARSITITNSFGVVAISRTTSQKVNNLDISNLSQGSYFVSVTTDAGVSVKRLMISQ
jgi:hypothetical protein